MAADWGVYMNNDLGHLASVGVDLEYRDTGPVSSYPTLVIVGMRFKAPRQNGLPQKDELQIVYAIEDRLSDLLGNKTNSRYVGRKLSDGSVKFFFYASDAAVVTAAAKTVGVAFQPILLICRSFRTRVGPYTEHLWFPVGTISSRLRITR